MSQQPQFFSEKDFQRILSLIRKNWWVLIVFIGIGFLVGKLYVYKLTNIYTAQCKVLLQSNEEYTPGSIVSDNSFYRGASKTFVDNSNEKNIISSYDLIKKTLERLDFNVSYYVVGRLKEEEMFMGTPFRVKIIAINNKLNETKFDFKILDNDHYQVKYVTENDEEKTLKGKFGDDLLTTNLHFIIS